MSNDRSENKDCRSLKEALTSYHSELVSELGGIEAELKACHDEQQSEEANATVKQRQLATDTYRQETSQANLRTTATLQNLIEGRYAKRKETMAASNKPDYQEIMDELQLHHARVQNILSEGILSPTPSSGSV